MAGASRPAERDRVELVRFQVPLPGMAYIDSNRLAISPDGRRVAYVTSSGLQLHELASGEPVSVPGTLGALQPFFSPDSQSVGFFSESDLMAVGVGGGPATAIARVSDSADIRGGAWGSDGSIVVGHSGAPTSGLVLVPADGGEPEVLTSPTPPGDSYRFPQYLPGGRRILFTHETAESDTRADKRSAVYSLDDETVRTLPHRGTHFRYLPTGHLIYGRGGGLAAVPFDVEALEATGPERMVMAGVAIEPDIGAVDASVSDTGHLIFLTAIDSEGWLAWIDPAGGGNNLR